MNDFLSVVAAPALQQAIEKGLFGKPYVRLGRLFIVIGMWLYQQGGVFGYALKEQPGDLASDLVVRLLGGTPSPGAPLLEEHFREGVARRLTEVEGKERNFFQLYTVRELTQLGIDFPTLPPSKELGRKAQPEMVSTVMSISFINGVAHGYIFPESFREYWENTYRIKPDNEWQEMRALLGLPVGEKQESRPLVMAVAEVVALAAAWAAEGAPGSLNAQEMRILNQLAGGSAG